MAEARARAKTVTWRRLLTLARPEAGMLVAGTASLLIASAIGLAYPEAVKWMIDSAIQAQDRHGLDIAAGLLITLFLIQSVFTAVRAWLYTIAGERVVARLRSQLFDAILGQDMAFFDKSRTGELTSRLASDTTVLQNAVTVNISMLLRFALSGVGGIAMMGYTSPRLTLVALAVVPFVAVAASLYGRMLRGLTQEVQDSLADASNVAEEALSGVRTVRAFAREPRESKRYYDAVMHAFDLAARRARTIGVFNGVAGFAGYGAIALVVWYGGRLVLDGTMTIGDLTAFLLYTGVVAMSFGVLAGLWGDFMKAIGASERVFELIDQRATLEQAAGDALPPVTGAVAFEDVVFAYPSRPDVSVLTGLDLALSPGEVVALVGHSGAGKSTVTSLLLRFYDPERGRITVDGRDVRTLSPKALREQIGIVSQEPILFATSIAENIRYGRPGATDGEVREAAEAANALDFVENFPDGFGTLVGERGVQLSGGQKQRVAIARALLKNPPILILDEATSALDAESEHLVQEALDRLMKGRTTIVIAHRLSTVQGADRVVVIDGGRAAESGTHAELVARDGVYRRLVQRQFAGIEALSA